ncbi:MAG: stage II sporulation protein M, partial [Bacteroidota bacterium]
MQLIALASFLMHEVVFIQERADTWEQLEAVVEDEAEAPPDEVADLYVQVTDDLAYARTFYPESEVVAYLNTLAQKTHRQLYRGRATRPQRIWRFWMQEVPTAVREARSELLLAALIFGLAVVIGTLSALQDSSFVRLIMGDHYVNMTLDNIEQG